MKLPSKPDVPGTLRFVKVVFFSFPTPQLPKPSSSQLQSQDAFGNYVVQYVLELGRPEASACVIQKLRGNLAELSLQKFSSNVVEKCLKLSGVDVEKEAVVRQGWLLLLWQGSYWL